VTGSQSVDGRAWFRCCRSRCCARLGRRNFRPCRTRPRRRRARKRPLRATDSQQLQRLVAPIALYPDSLVAQVLAASTFPEQVVEADRWVQANPDLKGDALGKAVDQQPWDPSVKSPGCISLRPWKYG